MSFVKHLECSRCSQTYSHRALHNLCPACHSPLLVRYNLRTIKRHVKKTELQSRPTDMWRYVEVMPVDREDDIVTLGEGFTPLLPLDRFGQECGLEKLYLKDEALNPTGSFKARGLSAAVSMARKLGVQKAALPSAGNAASALAAYGAKAHMEIHIFIPKDTPAANRMEAEMLGARVQFVDGVITDAARAMASQAEQEGWFDLSTLKEPYRIEGKKTMGYELAEQFSWKLPDVIFYPTGGGTGLIGMWKAFGELEELGWIDARRPRMVVVQSKGCAPIVKAFQEGWESAQPWPSPETLAAGLRVPSAIGDFLMLRILRESRGHAIAVSDDEIYQSIQQMGAEEGIFLCPEGAACCAALKTLSSRGWIKPHESALIFNTAAGVKYIDSLKDFKLKTPVIA
ncbi:MAG: threonine synthase [Acidobacteriota bacterium]